MEDKRLFYDADDIAGMLGISKASSYKLIKRMNEELAEKGFFCIPGKISKIYFHEKWYGGMDNMAVG